MMILPIQEPIVPYIFFLLGIGVLVPWNIFISLKSYYETRFCSDNDTSNISANNTASTTTTKGIESIFATIYNLSSILTMILLISIRLLRDQWSRSQLKNGYDAIIPIRNVITTTTGTNNNNNNNNNTHRHHLSFNTSTEENMTNSPHPTLDFGVSSLLTTTTTTTKHTSSPSRRRIMNVVLEICNPSLEEEDQHHDQHDDQHHDIIHRQSQQHWVLQPSSPIQHVLDNNHRPMNEHYLVDYYSLFFVIIPFLITIMVFLVQLIMVLYNNDVTKSSIPPFGYDIYTITLLCIATCGITTALLGTGIITVITTLSSIIPSFDQTMNPYQYGISMAGVAVSVINFLIAMTKDPISYYTTNCNDSDTSNTTSLSLWRPYDAEQHRSIIATTDRSLQYELLVEQSSTCQPYTTIDYAVFCYFLIAILLLLLCLCGFMYIQRILISQTRGNMSNMDSSIAIQDHVETTTTAAAGTTASIPIHRIHSEHEPDHILYNRQSMMTNEMNHLMPTTTTTTTTTITNDSTTSAMTSLSLSSSSSPVAVAATIFTVSPSSFVYVFQCIYGPTGGIFLTFCITLGLFPSWTTELRSIYECHNDYDSNNSRNSYSLLTRYANDLYIPFTFVLFNVGDLFGRIIATTSRFQMTPTAITRSSASNVSIKILYLAGLRLAFFPLLLICPTSMDSIVFGLTIHSDVYSIMIQLLFAMTNGYIIATSFAQAPKLLLLSQHDVGGQQQQQQERMSEILSCAINFGLFTGSLLSLLVTHITSSTIPKNK